MPKACEWSKRMDNKIISGDDFRIVKNNQSVFVYSVVDCTPFGNKLILITDNGALGMGSGNDAFYLDMDDEAWHYIGFAKSIQFDEDRSKLKLSSPTDESYEHFEERIIDLSDL